MQQQQQHQSQQQGGVGMSDVIVPLLLLYASQRYGRGKTAKSNAKSMRRGSRRFRGTRKTSDMYED